MNRLEKAAFMFFASMLIFLSGEAGATEPHREPTANSDLVPVRVPRLPSPYRTSSLPTSTGDSATAPVIDNGHIIQFHQTPHKPGQPNIYLFNRSGQIEYQVSICPTNSTQVWLTSVTVAARGGIIFAGHSIDDRGNRLLFIGSSDLDGSNPHFFSTGTYLATLVTGANDSSIWSLGAEFHDAAGSGQRWDNYDTVRHFSSSGTLLEHFLPRWNPQVAYVTSRFSDGNFVLDAYDTSGHPVVLSADSVSTARRGYRDAGTKHSQMYLKTASGVVNIYDGINEVFYQYDTATRVLSQYRIATRFTGVLNGFALTQDGHLFGSISGQDPRLYQLHGLFELKQDSSTGHAHWMLIDGTPSSKSGIGDIVRLLGADGDDLVFQTRQPEGSPRSISWTHR
ncbi:hypothetical protein EDE15_4241 [Edaphobacter aggregans]|uniref:YD repeat-containing protein n=1 Tax=Edaphobacter aggregans TaxID=570835 RepID=A0A428MP42_9BACT|nr:hypothetical protein [Edaphobacter aggregans]RSL18649.1 hypothetical protein EDE15_4241 [Edaphobacter aggregans]